MAYYYKISWTSVDGAGSSDEQITDQQIAIRKADAEQEGANKDGNPWGYTYKVVRSYTTSCRRDDVYNARTKKLY
jgi:hypothetical protein